MTSNKLECHSAFMHVNIQIKIALFAFPTTISVATLKC